MLSFDNLTMNAPERSEYAHALCALEPVLHNLPPVIVVIDGGPGVGKTTLGRFLAWRFNVSLLESDLFLISGRRPLTYRVKELGAVIGSRIIGGRPIIVEGVVALRLLRDLGRQFNFHIHVTCADARGGSSLDADFSRYVSEFKPATTADLVLDLPAIGE